MMLEVADHLQLPIISPSNPHKVYTDKERRNQRHSVRKMAACVSLF